MFLWICVDLVILKCLDSKFMIAYSILLLLMGGCLVSLVVLLRCCFVVFVLMCCRLVVLLCCWFVALVCCFVVLLFRCFIVCELTPKNQHYLEFVPKGTPHAPKRLPKGSQKGLQRTMWGPCGVHFCPMASRVARGDFCSRFLGVLGPFWVPFWDPVGSRGGPKIQLLGTKSA